MKIRGHDGIENSQPDTVEINVVDTNPPQLHVSVNPTVLWPPNNKMVRVTPTVTATDNCDPYPKIHLVSITMNVGDKTIWQPTVKKAFSTFPELSNSGESPSRIWGLSK